MDNIARQAHERREEGVNCDFLNVDVDFLNTYQIKLLAGRNFRLGDATTYDLDKEMDNGRAHKIMINKVAAQTLGFESIEDALNKKIIFPMLSDGTEGIAEIIGVIENIAKVDDVLLLEKIIKNNNEIIKMIWKSANIQYSFLLALPLKFA